MDKFNELFQQLNDTQRQAVDKIDGPVLVLAGPGTGKTQVLALRIANILKKTQMNAYNILCLTFTESAAHEMRERLTSIIGTAAYDVAIHTFHGFANCVIQEFPYTFNSHLGEEGESELIQYTQLDDFSRFKIIEGLLTKNHWDYLTPLKNNLIHLQQIARHLQEFKRERIAPDFLKKETRARIVEYASLLDDEKITKTKKASIDIEIQKCKRTLELCKLYTLYNRELARASRYDYEDMINWVVDALKNDPELALIYQEKYQYILVDEFQDTNNAQLELMNQLTSFYKDIPNLFVVGDPNQSIYRFQGASNYNIEQFKERYKNVCTVTLATNYRSGQGIIDAGSTLIHNNQTQAVQKAHTKRTTQTDVTVYLHAHQEAYEIARALKARIAQKIILSDCAVLVRRNDQITDFVHALSLEKIPFQVIKGECVLNHPFVQKVLLLADIIVDPSNPIAFAQLFYVFHEHFSLRDADIIKKATFKKNKISGLTTDAINFLHKIDTVATRIHELPLANAFIVILESFDILKNALKDTNRLEKITLLKALYNNAKKETGTLPEWLAKLHAMRTYNLDITSEPIVYGQEDAVVISTVHQAKGKEYDTVFLPQLHQNIWSKANRSIFYMPTLNAENDEHEVNIKEERRLLYVGMTRAKTQLHLSYSEYDMQRAITPSRYIWELPGISTHHKNEHVEKTMTRITHQLSPLPPVTFSQIETAWIKEIVVKQALSPTGFTTYKNCPKNYLIKNILRIPQVKSASQSYGTAIHTALEHYFLAFKNSSILPPYTDLSAYYYSALENEHQLTKIDKGKFIHDGEILLKRYYNTRSENFEIPIQTERSFRNVFMEDIPLSGKIDKIEWINPKTNTVRVVDYKTGHAKSRNALLGLTKDKDTDYLYQLKFYQLLSQLDHSFYLKWKIGESTLEFLDSEGKFSRESFTFTLREIQGLKNEIKDVWQKIQSLQFPHNSDSKWRCDYCDIIE